MSYLQTLLSIAILLSTFTGSKDSFSLSECYHSHKIGNEHLKNIVKYSLNITLNIHMAFNCLFRF